MSKKKEPNSVINGNTVGLVVLGLLVLNILGPIASAAGQLLAIQALVTLGLI